GVSSMPCFFWIGEPTIRQPPPEILAAPPGSAALSKAMTRAPADRASMPAAVPAPPVPTMATSVSYCFTCPPQSAAAIVRHDRGFGNWTVTPGFVLSNRRAENTPGGPHATVARSGRHRDRRNAEAQG